jgi:hypothetical protein
LPNVSELVSDGLLDRAAPADVGAPAISQLEFLPGWLVYGPVIAQWLALGLWHGDLSLPTAANPMISTGGLCGERKSAILGLAGGAARQWVAPWTTVVTGQDDVSRATCAMRDAGLELPVVVKPDIGCNGTGVRLVRDVAALAEALAAFTRGVSLVLQAFIDMPGEAGIFYIRHPDEAAGQVTSLTLKRPPAVIGNGVSTLRALIDADPRHRRLVDVYGARLGARLAEIPAAGARVQLVFAGNHCKGSIFANGAAEITAALTARVDAIAKDIPQFYFGRFDVRFGSLAALRRGEDFSIIEINGVGSEATHIWDPATKLRAIWADQLRHYGAAWAIAAALRQRGARPSGLRAMWRDWRTQIRLMGSYPVND